MTAPLASKIRTASFVVDPALQGDRLFDLNNRSLNRDNCLYGFWTLRKELQTIGIELKTCDLNSPETSDLILLNERPRSAAESALRENGLLKKSILMIFESSLIRPDNWDVDFHKEVAGVLTWSSDLLALAKSDTGNVTDQESRHEARYARGGFTHKFPATIPGVDASDLPRTKLVTLIAGNKSVSSPIELYTARRDAIAWFEKYAPTQFTYFGVGWEHSYLRGGLGTKVLRKLGLLRYLPERRSRCFGGKVDSKLETMKQFDFSICFENAEQIPGYISEKIFDSFFAGCIPVYWGAPDIEKLIPDDCFIDFRKFRDFEKLFRFLTVMTADEKLRYRGAIRDFLNSDSAKIFNADLAAREMALSIDSMLQMAASLEQGGA